MFFFMYDGTKNDIAHQEILPKIYRPAPQEGEVLTASHFEAIGLETVGGDRNALG